MTAAEGVLAARAFPAATILREQRRHPATVLNE
jgi:hypothetical protein